MGGRLEGHLGRRGRARRHRQLMRGAVLRPLDLHGIARAVGEVRSRDVERLVLDDILGTLRGDAGHRRRPSPIGRRFASMFYQKRNYPGIGI